MKKNYIDINLDEETLDYYAVWEQIAIGMGETSHKALEDLREAAHFGVDTFINLKLKEIGQGKED